MNKVLLLKIGKVIAVLLTVYAIIDLYYSLDDEINLGKLDESFGMTIKNTLLCNKNDFLYACNISELKKTNCKSIYGVDNYCSSLSLITEVNRNVQVEGYTFTIKKEGGIMVWEERKQNCMRDPRIRCLFVD